MFIKLNFIIWSYINVILISLIKVCFQFEKVSSQVAFNSQRIKTKDESGNAENINHVPRERNGSPRKLNHVEDAHHSNTPGKNNKHELHLLDYKPF